MTTISRRDWLKYLGALTAGGVVANVSGCAGAEAETGRHRRCLARL
jgi:hypothetical protein